MYAIKNKVNGLYWCNDTGWGEVRQMFSDEEQRRDDLPIDGVWEKMPDIRIEVRDTATAAQVKPMVKFLTSKPCECKESEFLCYPENGACTCGVHKHHVHCRNCGGISQWG